MLGNSEERVFFGGGCATQDSIFVIDGTGVSVHFFARFFGKTIFKQLPCYFKHLYIRYWAMQICTYLFKWNIKYMLRVWCGKVGVGTWYNLIVTAGLARATGFVALGEDFLNIFFFNLPPLFYFAWLDVQYTNSTYSSRNST